MKNKKLHILVIQQSPDIGGAEIFMASLLSEFISQGHKVTAVVNDGKFYELMLHSKIQTKKIPYILDISGNYKGLIKSVFLLPVLTLFYIWVLKAQKGRVDVILMSGFSEKMLVTFLSVFFSIPIIWIEYGPLETIFKRNFFIPRIIYNLLKGLPKVIVVPSYNTKKSIQQTGISASKLQVIPCGIEVPQSIKKSAYPGWEEKFIVGCTSRLTYEKGQEYLIRAISRIIHKEKDIRFLFVGGGPDEMRYKKLVTMLNIEDVVSFTGFVPDANIYYKYFNAFVFPSIWDLEGFGLVAVEAMAREIPVIANNMGPIPEIVDDKVGIKVDIKNEKELANAVIKLRKDIKLQKSLGIAGRKKVKINYDIKKVSKRYEDIFYNVLLRK